MRLRTHHRRQASGTRVVPALLLLALTGACRGSDPLGLRVRGAEESGPVLFGRASSYGVLAGTSVDNTGSTTVVGDLGVSPGRSVTGFPTVVGTVDVDALKAALAQEDMAAAFGDAISRSRHATGISGNLGGRTLPPGLYHSSSALSLTGTLTLDGQGNSSAVFVIQAPSLTTSASSQVALTGGADSANVTWAVLGSATLGAGSSFEGSILAGRSIALGAGADMDGRALAHDGAVTLNSNVITAR